MSCPFDGRTGPVGACCLPDGTCEQYTVLDCLLRAGTHFGEGSNCVVSLCLPDTGTGACCLPSGGCAVLTRVQCFNQSGLYMGTGSACGDFTCSAGIGACCVGDTQICATLTQEDCAATGGWWMPGGSCWPGACFGEVLGCDWNHDGTVNQNDLTAFLASWFAGVGDFDHDGVTTDEDVSQFVECLLEHGPG
jgi:hypothetical protein